MPSPHQNLERMVEEHLLGEGQLLGVNAVQPRRGEGAALQKNEVSDLANYFDNIDTDKYFCILYATDIGSGLIYAFNSSFVNQEMRSRFVKAFRYFKETADAKAKMAHYSQRKKETEEKWFIGGIYTSKSQELTEFLGKCKIWLHLSNLNDQDTKRRLHESGIPMVSTAVNFLRSCRGKKDIKYKLPEESPLKPVLDEIIELYNRSY